MWVPKLKGFWILTFHRSSVCVCVCVLWSSNSLPCGWLQVTELATQQWYLLGRWLECLWPSQLSYMLHSWCIWFNYQRAHIWVYLCFFHPVTGLQPWEWIHSVPGSTAKHDRRLLEDDMGTERPYYRHGNEPSWERNGEVSRVLAEQGGGAVRKHVGHYSGRKAVPRVHP